MYLLSVQYRLFMSELKLTLITIANIILVMTIITITAGIKTNCIMKSKARTFACNRAENGITIHVRN